MGNRLPDLSKATIGTITAFRLATDLGVYPVLEIPSDSPKIFGQCPDESAPNRAEPSDSRRLQASRPDVAISCTCNLSGSDSRRLQASTQTKVANWRLFNPSPTHADFRPAPRPHAPNLPLLTAAWQGDCHQQRQDAKLTGEWYAKTA